MWAATVAPPTACRPRTRLPARRGEHRPRQLASGRPRRDRGRRPGPAAAAVHGGVRAAAAADAGVRRVRAGAARRRVGGGPVVRRLGHPARRRAGLRRAEVPERAGRRRRSAGGRRVGAGACPLRLGRARRRDRRAHRHRAAAGVEVRHARPARALPRAGHPRREGRGTRNHRARRRLRRRRHQDAGAAGRGGFVVNGSKMFITNGVRADFIVTAVKTTEEGGHHGISFLIVDRGEGVSASPIEKLGWHASDTALIAYDDVFVPEENLLGAEHEGFKLIMANFQWERVMMALGAVGAMEVVFERTPAYAKEREAFGRSIGTHQAIRHKLAEVAVALETGRAITYNALRMHLAGMNAVQEVTMAKLATQRAAYDAADTCLQIHGGYGYLVDAGIERAVRDLRLGPIGGGTDEIMREILGKTLGL